LQREIAALPVHISAIEKKLISHERKLEADAPLWWPTRRNASRARAYPVGTEDFEAQRADGRAKTNEQYRAFQSEIDFCQAEIASWRTHSGFDGESSRWTRT